MKTTIKIFFLTLATLQLSAQSEEIKIIRAHFNYVESNLHKFKKVAGETFEESSEGATIQKYFDADNLVKVRNEYFGETGKLIRELFIKEQQLLFAYDQEFRYNMPIYIDDKKAQEMGFEEGFDADKTVKGEHRYYFFDNELIRWINPEGKDESVDHPEWKKKQQYYLDELSKFQ